MKVLKPDSLALLYRSLRFGRRNLLSLGLMGLFRFDRAELGSEPELWAAAAAALGQDQVLDEGLPKPAGEFLAYGACHSAGGVPVQQLPVNVRVGGIEKTLYVFGDRHFTALGGISSPQPFVRMPVDATHAFGGAGHAVNPLGIGAVERVDTDGVPRQPLPNIETPAALVMNSRDTPAPAGYGAVPSSAPERRRQLGRFDDAWLKHTWPHLPEDTQPDYFQAAPRDQRMAGFFRGDEAVAIGNMHPSRALITTRLPGLRARCFVNRRAGNTEEFVEVDTRLETVWLFPELECGIVLYRAVQQTLDEQADDVLHLLAEWESQDQAPLPLAHYRELFERRIAAAAEAPEPAAAPPAAVAAGAEAAAAPAAAAVAVPAGAVAAVPLAEDAELERMGAELEKMTADLKRQHGVKDSDVQALMKHGAPDGEVSLDELERLSAEIEKQTAETLKKHGVTAADAEKLIPAKAAGEAAPDLAGLQASLQQIESGTQKLMAGHGMTDASLRQFAASHPGLGHLSAYLGNKPELGALFAGLEELPVAAALPAMPQMPALPELAPAPAQAVPPVDRDYVIARHARRQNFAGHDLSGLDLSGLDLAGADFADAVLEKTRFADSRLAGANFGRSLLKDADFNGADLTKAGLAGVSAGAATFAGARMEGSDVSAADFSGADFSATKLSGANLSGSVFDGAKMAGFAASGCRADKTRFNECDLKGADFSNANLAGASFSQACIEDALLTGTRCEKTEFYGTQATRANFGDANLKGSRADQATQFADARFTGANLGRANWEGAGISKALFDRAVLDDADFSRVAGVGAQFAGASAKGAKFDKADLANADFTRVNLFKGSFRAARLETTALKFANLYGADFYGTTTTAANTEGSVIDNTLLPVRRIAT